VLRLRPEPDAEREEACQQWLVSAPGWKRDESEGENVTLAQREALGSPQSVNFEIKRLMATLGTGGEVEKEQLDLIQ
jgi:hypothetical protein